MRQVAEAKQEAEARRGVGRVCARRGRGGRRGCHRRRQGGGRGQGECARGEDAARRARLGGVAPRRLTPPKPATTPGSARAPLRDQGAGAAAARRVPLEAVAARASPRAPGSKSPRASAATPRSAMIQCSPLVAKSPRVRDTSGFARGMTPGRVGTAAFAPPTPEVAQDGAHILVAGDDAAYAGLPSQVDLRRGVVGGVGRPGRMTPGRLSIRNRPSLGGGALASSLSFPTMSSPPLPPPPSDAPGGPDHDKRPKVIRSNKSNLPRPGQREAPAVVEAGGDERPTHLAMLRGRAPRRQAAAPRRRRSRCPSSGRRRRRARPSGGDDCRRAPAGAGRAGGGEGGGDCAGSSRWWRRRRRCGSSSRRRCACRRRRGLHSVLEGEVAARAQDERRGGGDARGRRRRICRARRSEWLREEERGASTGLESADCGCARNAPIARRRRRDGAAVGDISR